MTLNNRILGILQHKQLATNISELYISYNTLPINKLFQYQLLLHAHNILFNINKLPIIFHSARLTNDDIHNYNTRSSHDFHCSTFNSTFGSKMSCNLCAKLWNSLTSSLKHMRSRHSFKNELKKFLNNNDI